MKHLLTLSDLSRLEIENFLDRAMELKRRQKQGTANRSLVGKTLGLLFNKASTRTRAAFEAAMVQMGGVPLFISTKDTQMSRDEPIKDTARVLSRYFEGLAIRTYAQNEIEEFAAYSQIPVINALTDLYHPCQVLSDLMTVLQFKKSFESLKIAWVGDGNNMAHSWINAAGVLGLNLYLACPEGYWPQESILQEAKGNGAGEIVMTSDPIEAVKEADIVNTDVWASMGQESEQQSRLKVFNPFQVNSELLKNAAKDAIVLHCLPAHRGEEITADVLEGEHSVVWEQSENKLHMHKSILEILINQ
jgi:ornithine carbamoyltransferase